MTGCSVEGVMDFYFIRGDGICRVVVVVGRLGFVCGRLYGVLTSRSG